MKLVLLLKNIQSIEFALFIKFDVLQYDEKKYLGYEKIIKEFDPYQHTISTI